MYIVEGSTYASVTHVTQRYSKNNAGDKMKGKMIYISADILAELGCLNGGSKEVDNAIRRILGLGDKISASAVRVESEPKKPRANLRFIKSGETMVYPRSEYRFESILQNVYRYNSTRTTMAVWCDDKNTYVYRYKGR